METFLDLVAKNIYELYGNDLSRIAIIFPNRRARLFFNESLIKLTDKPIWSPAYISVKDLFQEWSPYKLGDPIELICRLYRVFRNATKSNETLDSFYFWGQLLISDFDDVDKNLVNANQLFGNLKDLQDLADNSFLDPEQEEAIQHFFTNFSIEKETKLKEKFISLWNVLGNIYNDFKKELADNNIAYEGMMYRDVIEHIDANKLKYDKYVFVGFNVLNKVEHRLFDFLRDSNKALFYWDYDIYYTNDKMKEAGRFILRDIQDFGQDLQEGDFNNIAKTDKKITFIAASTENAQARYLPGWINKYVIENKGQKASECAIVLCNESLLLPVLHSLPDATAEVNITMGYPLMQTPVYSLISALMDLQTSYSDNRYTYQTVHTVLQHPYVQRIAKNAATDIDKKFTKNNKFYPKPEELSVDNDFMKTIFTPVGTKNENVCEYLLKVINYIANSYRNEKQGSYVSNQLYSESLFQAYTIINRMYSLVTEGLLDISTVMFRHLLEQLLAATNIPFHGEPAVGLQIMGVLETRNLDFKHLVMLSLNEGQLPKSSSGASFIPYNLRKAFGMTLIEQKDSIYAYYFYRLIQRAETVTLLYNNSTEGTNAREMSRFMLQMLVEWPGKIEKHSLESKQSILKVDKISIKKTDEIINRLVKRFTGKNNKGNDNVLSPSALNTYLNCQLKFYLSYVAGLKPEDEVTTDIDNAMFGTIFHKTAENIYKSFDGRLINKFDLETLLKVPNKISQEVDNSFKTEFFKIDPKEKSEYNGTQRINRKAIEMYIHQLLQIDLRNVPFKVIGTESPVNDSFIVTLDADKQINITVGGTIDRINEKEGTVQLIDYKTGGTPLKAKDLESLFTPDEKRPGYILQIMLYADLLLRKGKAQHVTPSLLYIHRAANEDYSPIVSIDKTDVTDFADYRQEFESRLEQLLNDIFDRNKTFEQTAIDSFCEYCDFKTICGK